MIDDEEEIGELLAELLKEPPDEVWRRLEAHPQAELLIELLEEQGFPWEDEL